MAKIIRTVLPLPQTDRGDPCHIAIDSTGERILYCNGSNVIWRPLAAIAEEKVEAQDDLFCWKGHVKRTTCAAFAPNSQWVVSGDVTGALRLWGAKGDHIQKNEYKLWDGTVKDVCWSGDSTRIFAGGDGKQVRAAALIWDAGSKTGEVGNLHAKQVTSISFRSQRPFRVVTGSEDMTIAFHQGPPFKFTRAQGVHSNCVNVVRYSPDGDWVISGGGDSKLFLYEGKEGELLKEFDKPEGIAGSLWAAAWSPDSAQVVTAGGDRKLRVWGREAGAQLAEAQVGAGTLEDMQIGVAWASAGRIVSTCLDGRILVWDVAADGALSLKASMDGTQGPLTCVACDIRSGAVIHGGSEGCVAVTKPGCGPMKAKVGKGVQHVLTHTAAFAGPLEAWVFALDECARRVSLESGEFVGSPVEVKEFVTGAGWMDESEEKVVAVTSKGSFIGFSSAGVDWRVAGKLPRSPTSMASHAGRVAVGIDKPDGFVSGVQSQRYEVMLFSVSEQEEEESRVVLLATLERHQAEVCIMRFSPDGQLLASGDAGNKIIVWDMSSQVPVVKIADWCLHTARVTSLDWLPGGKHLVSGSLDRIIYVWNMEAPTARVQIQDAHKGGTSAVAACGSNSFASVGLDGFLFIHEIA